MLTPVLFLPHGGGPLPLLNDPSHTELTHFLKSVSKNIPRPESILVITAHWEKNQPGVTAQQNPELVFDYYGFPPEAYTIQYPAAGNPQLASDIVELLNQSGFNSTSEFERGFDHGTFVPLKLLYPLADIPVVQLSLLSNLDPALHIQMGEALAELRNKNVLIIGSGMSFHNMRAFFSSIKGSTEKSEMFDNWLVDLLTNQTTSFEEKREELIRWPQAPAARFAHPREEHLMPLLVCFGAAKRNASAECIFRGLLLNSHISSFSWQ